MSHQIPTLKSLVNTIGDYVEKEHGTEVAKAKLLLLFRMLQTWKARGRSSGDAMEILTVADRMMDAHGVEYLSPAEQDPDHSVYGGNGAYYVNTGETYNGTLLYDEKKMNFYATSWGDFVEQAERRGRKF